MDDCILKSFLLEIFISLSILFLLVSNIRFINTLNYNFPIINKEIIFQLVFLLICSLGLSLNSKIFGALDNFLFLNSAGIFIFKNLLIIVTLIVLFIVGRAINLQKINFYEYLILFLLVFLAMLLLISSVDILSAYLVIETQALCFYILASFKRDSSFSTEAGLKYFISGSFISGIFLAGSSIIYGCLGTLTFNNLFNLLTIPFYSEFKFLNLFLTIGILLVTVSLLFKLSAAPFHFWSPDVYEGSPLASTIIFSIMPKISILVFFIRWVFSVSNIFLNISSLFLLVGIISVFFGTVFALRQKRVKRLIIYSSIAQIGFLVIPFLILTLDSFSYLCFFLVIYIITSILIWGNLILFYDSFNCHNGFLLNNLNTFFVSNLSGLFKVNKIQAFSFILIFFSISGIPPFAGFLAKIFIFLTLLQFKQLLASFLIILLNLISVYYYIRIIKIIFFETKSLANNNLEFQMTYKNTLQVTLIHILAFCLFSLIYIYISPSILYLIVNFGIFGLDVV